MFKQTLLTAALATAATSALAAPLKLEVFNPGEAAIFPVASVLVTGDHDAVLIDAQFSRAEALKLVERIRASGKVLRTVYISHSDPDFFFGLDVIQDAFPQARIVATAGTVAAMQKKAAAKLAHWGAILKDNAPRRIVMPQVLAGDSIVLEDKVLNIVGPSPDRSVVHIPSLNAVVGGVVLFQGLHVWMADTQTPASRQHWLGTLDAIAALKPAIVVPGHFKVGAAMTPDSITYTRNYIIDFEKAAAVSANAAALVAAMRGAYPDAGLDAALQLSAKVAKGEQQW
jgi:glyoxylase-like metal-dependent hydrolase (beta-lactamase superfamily II)